MSVRGGIVMQEIIKDKLKEIEEKENVTIFMAVESGSRAWGFASPDSDYDVRFIYVRKKEDYLRLDAVRDVIDWQLDDVLDINGWDVKKALQLMHNSNPTIFEWCESPIVYRTSAGVLVVGAGVTGDARSLRQGGTMLQRRLQPVADKGLDDGAAAVLRQQAGQVGSLRVGGLAPLPVQLCLNTNLLCFSKDIHKNVC